MIASKSQKQGSYFSICIVDLDLDADMSGYEEGHACIMAASDVAFDTVKVASLIAFGAANPIMTAGSLVAAVGAGIYHAMAIQDNCYPNFQASVTMDCGGSNQPPCSGVGMTTATMKRSNYPK
eukprot:gnl/MRDRNA2_/MRDRNA2_85844_c0_seq2.p2 gnl/MRDRNA2_/MRDRNA2_85844_c0~~gnl/MRDRNA2_/MRDRNA2_85844_c0_seq2.p2  ORF type:complete len:123 (+),score=17.00 gnl/MRDRNA2_/MRDRNA2_85844_c0_seq2:314-682(+)